MSLIRILHGSERDKLFHHFMAMSKGDLYKRFCRPMTDQSVRHYVDKVDFAKSTVFGIDDGMGGVSGVAELYGVGEQAECAFSVLPEAQGRGHGHALMDRVVLYAKNAGIKHLTLMCLSDNPPMRHLAKEAGMTLHIDGPDVEAAIQLPPATSSDRFDEIMEGATADFSHATTENIRKTGEFVGAVTNGWVSLLVPWKNAFGGFVLPTKTAGRASRP